MVQKYITWVHFSYQQHGCSFVLFSVMPVKMLRKQIHLELDIVISDFV